jgi:hypothetical protein
MKSITACAGNKAYRQARICAAGRQAFHSRVVQDRISTLPGLLCATLEFPQPDAGANTSEATSSVASSAQKRPFPAQSSAQKPAFCRMFIERS